MRIGYSHLFFKKSHPVTDFLPTQPHLAWVCPYRLISPYLMAVKRNESLHPLSRSAFSWKSSQRAQLDDANCDFMEGEKRTSQINQSFSPNEATEPFSLGRRYLPSQIIGICVKENVKQKHMTFIMNYYHTCCMDKGSTVELMWKPDIVFLTRWDKHNLLLTSVFLYYYWQIIFGIISICIVGYWLKNAFCAVTVWPYLWEVRIL